MLSGVYNSIKRGHARIVMNIKVDKNITADINKYPIEGTTKPTPPIQAAKVPTIKNMDDTLYIGNGAQVKKSQFPHNWYMGEDEPYGI